MALPPSLPPSCRTELLREFARVWDETARSFGDGPLATREQWEACAEAAAPYLPSNWE